MPIYVAALFSLGIIVYSSVLESIWGKYVKRGKATLFLFCFGILLLLAQVKIYSINTLIYGALIVSFSVYICLKLEKKYVWEALLITVLNGMLIEIIKIIIEENYYRMQETYVYIIIGVVSGVISVMLNEDYVAAFLVSFLSPVFAGCIDIAKVAFENEFKYIIIGTNAQKLCLVCSIFIAILLIPIKFKAAAPDGKKKNLAGS